MILFSFIISLFANHLPVMYVQVPQWADDWAVCAVDIPDAKCHWYVMAPDNTFGEGFDWEEAPWFDATGLNDVAHGLSSTLEAEVIFPKRSPEKDDLFGLFPGNEVSLFGLHAVTESDTVLTWLNDTINFNVIAIKCN